jgi:hypothetical protein
MIKSAPVVKPGGGTHLRRIFLSTIFILTGILGLAGCGGGAGVALPAGDNPDNGIYTAEYSYDNSTSSASKGVSAVGGNISIVLGKNNTVTVTVVDNVSGTFIGTGGLRSTESFSVTCTGAAGSVIVEGTLQNSALSKKFAGKARGSIKFSYDAPLAINNVTVTLFAGNYTGYLDMKNFDSHPATVDIDANGFILVTVTQNGAPVKLRGLLYSDGRVLLRPDDGQTINYWGKGSAYMFADLSNLFLRVSFSEKKDGKEIGMLRVQTPYLPE